MLLAAGTRFGPYEVLAPLGAGGMGQVYCARDTNLGRQVAIKVLPRELAQDTERLMRFRREAKVLASLNHPHIAQIYGVEGTALVMELVAGEAPRGPLHWKTALDYARQIAEALEVAHEKGIVHRDLKPANLMVTSEGVVKVLDFGLAAVSAGGSGDLPPGNSTTLTAMATQPGVLLGTAAYMSPEQASGRPVDKRADIWSFGVVLWELLTGRRLFVGESLSDTLAEVLRGPIELDSLPQEVPAPVRRLLARCLERDVRNRMRDIGEARIAIDSALANNSAVPEESVAFARRRQQSLAWGTAGVLAVGLASLAFLHFREQPPRPAAPVRFQIGALEENPGIPSPDGRYLAYRRGGRLMVYVLETGESRDLTTASNAVPFWSPDSHFIGYLYDRKIWKIETAGGTPQAVVEYKGLWGGGAWNQDGLIIYGDRRVGLFRVPAAGGAPVQITSLDPARHENSQYCPSFLPDGKHFVYIRGSTDEGKSAIYIGSLDARPEQQSTKPIVVTNSQPVFAPSAEPDMGYLLFVQGTRLMAQAFDSRGLELKGQAVAVADQVRNYVPGSTYIGFSASATLLGFPRNSLAQSQLIWQNSDGDQVGKVGEPAYLGRLTISPDGTRLAGTRMGIGADNTNIWLVDLTRSGADTRFTYSSKVDSYPVWSPDGSWIVFNSNRDGPYNLYRKAANGVQPEEMLLKSGEDKFATSWSRDGRFLLYEVDAPHSGADLWLLPLTGERKPVPFLVTEFDEKAARFSPDGHWVAYSSNESGKTEVYVRSFAMNESGIAMESVGKWKVSDGVGETPHWRADGRELYYESHGKIMAVEITPGPDLRVGRPRALGVRGTVGWDVTPDGKRFLTLGSNGKQEPMTFVMNWQSGLPK